MTNQPPPTLTDILTEIARLESIAIPMPAGDERSKIIKQIARLYLDKAELIAVRKIQEARHG